MNKNNITFIAWVLLMMILPSIGFYIYATTFVEGSLSGMNPYGILALGGGVLAAFIVFKIGCYKGNFLFNS
tara:strand:+ start:521 stop:733 length:213 start_codon:yes stop_codon:yes gene_type:complete